MKKQEINYLKQMGLTKRLVYSEDAISEMCEYFFKDLSKNNNAEFNIIFYSNSGARGESEEEEFTLNSDKKMNFLKYKKILIIF